MKEARSKTGEQDAPTSPWSTDGRYLEAGSPSVVNCAALAASIQLLLSSGGAPRLQAHVEQLQRMLLRQLSLHDDWRGEAQRLSALLYAQRLGPTLCFDLPAEKTQAQPALMPAANQNRAAPVEKKQDEPMPLAAADPGGGRGAAPDGYTFWFGLLIAGALLALAAVTWLRIQRGVAPG